VFKSIGTSEGIGIEHPIMSKGIYLPTSFIIGWFEFSQKQKLDKKWVIFFYDTHILFNVVQHLTFIEAMLK
jgi:hypothetical protein